MKRIALILAFLSLLPALSISDVAVEEIAGKQVLAAGPEWQENHDRFPPISIVDIAGCFW